MRSDSNMRNVDTLLRIAFLGSGVFALGCANSEPPSREDDAEAIAATQEALIADTGDLNFILEQIKIAEAHAGGTPLSSLVGHPQLPFGLRTVDGTFNNILPGQEFFGAADRPFPRLTTPVFRDAGIATFDPDGPGPLGVGSPTSYTQNSGLVFDPQPRVISNLIVDQSAANPAAVAAAAKTPGSVADVDGQGTFFIPNVAPDVGLSAPYNSWFTLFGQFFDHGLDLISKGGSGTVIIPLAADDPLFIPGSPNNFMVLDRATNQPGPDGILGTADDVHEHNNRTTPFVDQNQTYTSHPSHQVFLREYVLNAALRPVSTGRLIDGARGGIGNWEEVKAQAATMLGIVLTDADVFNVPLLVTDPYGKFIPGPNGFPQVVTASGTVEGNPAAPVALPANTLRIDHAFLDDIAHRAVPTTGLLPDADSEINAGPQPAGTYDDELLDAHFVTGDGRGNENIGLTAVHTIFHAEHNRLVQHVKDQVLATANPTFIAEWLLPGANQADGIQDLEWNGERLFQAARFGTEMQYQHLVFEEFARKVQPEVNVFLGYDTSIDPAIMSEFAHVVYRFGHSLLTETIARTDSAGASHDIGLIQGFLNPPAFGAVGTDDLDSAGTIIRGMTRQVGNEVDEFVTNALRNNLLGVPLDLATINMARGRDVGIPSLNAARTMFFADTGDSALRPYSSWRDYGFALRHPESLVNLVAAYGTHPSVTGVTSLADKRTAADALVNGGVDDDFMNATGAWANVETGLDLVDFWVGGLAEKQMIFGGLLGPTFNFVFETQMEKLQDGDRLYYLHRTAGINFLTQLEENSFSEMIMRNTNVRHLPLDAFSRPAFVFELGNLGTSGPILDDPATPLAEQDESQLLIRMPDGTIRYTGVEHIVMGGTPGDDMMWASEGDDTLWGDEGNDRLEGGDGNDSLNGGDGDDIITDLFGIDNIKGGAGNDVISAGPGLGDLILAGSGNDFVVAGEDPKETFGGAGNDFIFAGDSADTVFGGEGDDWIEGGDQADLLQGDNGAPFQDSPVVGNDVIFGQGGDDDYDAETGDDIMVSDFGIERHEGMLGFDWVTYKGAPQPADADLDLSVLLPPSVENFRDRFDLVEGLSGWDHDDILRGDDATTVELTEIDANSGQNNALNTQAQIDLIAGLQDLLGDGVTSFSGGNIILGGAGSDLIEGRGGDDIIDGDRWLNVRLSVRDEANNEIGTADGMRTPLQNKSGILAGTPATLTLQQAMFAGTLNPGQLVIVREILTAPPNPNEPDVDTALFSGPFDDYDILPNPDGSTTVIHARGTQLDGTDRLINIEMLQFANVAVSAGVPVSQPIGLTAVTFPDQEIATTSGIRSATLINAAATPLAISTATLQGVNGGDFLVNEDNCSGVTLLTGAFCNVSLTFRPNAVGTRSASLNFAVVSNGNPATLTAPVSGTGTAAIAMVTPNSLAFGDQALRVRSATQTTTFTNTGAASLQMGNVRREGAHRNDFEIAASSCNGQLSPNAQCTISVRCRPRALGLRSGELQINYNGASSPRVIPMTCNGVP
ncbi:MAG: choice-of-anchor D domain-containing protein [Polyangiaceae bacterium]|nr:choice-of-anchor D domain-containing protein [Polyangiaceae bacterium]